MSRERDGCCPPRAYEPGSCLIAGMCSSYQTQAQAADLAHKFNRRLGISTSRGDLQVHFLPCVVYTVRRHRDSRSKTSARLVIEETAGWATHPLAACGVATLCFPPAHSRRPLGVKTTARVKGRQCALVGSAEDRPGDNTGD
jgi:hypothetical protein